MKDKKQPYGKNVQQLKKLAEKPVAESQDFTALVLVHPPNLPLRPYLDDIWDALLGLETGLSGDLSLKANIASPTFTGTVVLPATTSVGTVSSAEIGFIDGLTSNAQTQLDGKNATLISGVNLKTINSTSLLGAGDISIVGGVGDMVLAAAQTVTAGKTFMDGTFLLRNVGNTFNGVFVNTNSADRTYTLKDANGTIAFTSDITGTNSGVNTGDQTSIVGITGTVAQFNTAITDGDLATGGGTATGTNTGDNATNTQYSGLVSSQWITDGSTVYYNTGNVGIGTPSAPTQKLQIYSSSDAYIHMVRATDATHGAFAISNSGSLSDTNRFWAVGKKALSESLYFWNWDGSVDTNALRVSKEGYFGFGFNAYLGDITTTPTAVLHLKAGTATANTGQLKLDASTLLGTTEAGAVENDGTHLYYTAANAGTRYQLDQQPINIAGGTLGAIPYQSGAAATTVLAATATANKILLSGASAAPVWSTPTFPNASATTGKVIKSDGTNWVASTETVAAPGTSGNVLTSDGTNWTSAAPAGGGQLMFEGGTVGFGTITDAQTLYFGSSAAAAAPTTTDSGFGIRFYSPVAGTINKVYVYFNSTIAGSNESWSMYLRVNATTDTLIQALSSTAQPRVWSNAALGISISAGDYFVIKSVNPTWATNPSASQFFKCIVFLDL